MTQTPVLGINPGVCVPYPAIDRPAASDLCLTTRAGQTKGEA